jgi:glyoxylase-like metal-dependent hydrolase (beta-lactamase superfamily II)
MVQPLGLHAFNPGPITGDGNWTWLLRGRVTTLIDAGTGMPRYLDSLQQALDGRPLAQVLVTHGHPDHASGAPSIAARMPGARFAKMPWAARDARWPVDWTPIADGDRIGAGDTTLVAMHTPGHAPDHVVFWDEASRSLFCGDLAIQGSTVWIPASHDGDLTAYLASLERALALDPVRMYPAHGPVIERPAALLRSYIDHRREREEQILDAMRKGDATPAAIVTRVYGGIGESVVPLARESVTAHLIKLEREGRALRHGDEWTHTDR